LYFRRWIGPPETPKKATGEFEPRQHVEHARHEAEVAQHRFLRVHPDNRLVADALEAEQRAAIANLVNDVPRLWRDPRSPHREPKRLTRLLLEDVTLLKSDQLVSC
jgi:hypothetical protein